MRKRYRITENEFKEYESKMENRFEKFKNVVPKSEKTKNQLDQREYIMNHPLNTIFYGPPGTGKTYNTLIRAAEIIGGIEITNYEDAKRIFNKYLGDQIEFITFHQNYSYEDFIQCLRPDVENEGGGLSFEKKDGIFKKIADRALKNSLDAERSDFVKKDFETVLKNS